jgi:TolA-binding protein
MIEVQDMRQCLLPIAFLCAMSGALVPLGTARAQMISSREGIALENQILELRQQLQQQSQGGNGGSALAAPHGNYGAEAPGQSAASAMIPNLLQQVQTLQDEVQSLRGRVDTLEHEVATQHDELNQEIGDLKFQLSQGAQQNTAAAPPAVPAPAAPRAAARPAAPSAADAERALAAHDYRGAEAGARALLAKNRTGPAGAEAQFIRAQALAGQGNSQSAAVAYDDAYNADKAGPHAPYALLGLANSLSNLRQNQAACDTLDSLSSQFSSPSPGLSRSIRAARAKAHCG